MLSDGTKAADFIKVLSPAIKSAGLSTQIACCDAEGWNDQKTFTAQLIAAGVESELGVITSHSYTSSPTSPISTNLHVWQTEYADLDDAFTPAWYSSGAAAEGLTWASHIYTAVVNANVSGYLHWVGAQANVNSAALINIVGSTITPSGRLWAFAMFSRFVRPGAVRVSATTTTTGLQTSAFKNTDGTVAVVIINTGSSAQTAAIAISGYTAASARGYITNNSNTVAAQAATLSGGQVSTSVPGYSMVTVVLSGSGSSSTTSTATTSSSSTGTQTSTTTSSTPSGGWCVKQCALTLTITDGRFYTARPRSMHSAEGQVCFS
jgi:O-glycosyl hydrolase